MLWLWIFPIFNNIFTANILDMWEKRRDFTSHPGVFLPSEPESQYICTKLLNTDDNDRTPKNDANILS